MNKYIEIRTTFDSHELADIVVNYLLEKRLVACCQVNEIVSTYHWKGKVENAKEYLLRAKTKKSLYNQVEDGILKLHSYETPEIICVDITCGSKEYLDWIERETI